MKHAARYVDRCYVKSELRNRKKLCNANKFFVCQKEESLSWKHSVKDCVRAFRENRTLQYVFATMENNEVEDKVRELADTIEEVLVNITEGLADSDAYANDNKTSLHIINTKDTNNLS